MLNLHRDKKIGKARELEREGKILSDHRRDGNVEAHRLQVRLKEKNKNRVRAGDRSEYRARSFAAAPQQSI